VAAGEAHRMASGAQTDPWGNFLRRSRHEYDSHAVPDGYPGPRSATWLRQLTHSLGIVTAERGIAGATRYPSAQTAENSRNAVKEPHIKRPLRKVPGIHFDHLAGSGRIDINRTIAGHGAATERIFAPRPSVDPRIAHAREANLTRNGRRFGGQQGARGPLFLEQGRDSPAFVLTDRSPVERTTSAKRPRWFNE
jgi:hypothetical protein